MLPRICCLLLAVVLVAAAPGPAPRLDSWKVIGPGGGGAQFLPTISPHNPNDVVVRCDMSGAYITHDGGSSWRMFNLRGVVRFFAWDPRNPATLYANSIGLFRSKDAGKTWSLVFPKPEDVARVETADDHSGESIVTRDGARPAITAFAIDPDDSNILYAAIRADRSTSFAVSLDAGATWEKQAPLPQGARAILVGPASPPSDRTIYVAGAGSVAVRERGKWRQAPPPADDATFTDVTGGFGADGRLTLYAIAPSRTTRTSQLYVSRDGGDTWEPRFIHEPGAEKPQPRLVAVACSLRHPETAYVSYSRLVLDGAGYFGVAKTEDSGTTWKLAWKESGTSAPNIHDAWLSERFGPGWGENPINLGVSPADPNVCYGTDYGRTMRTTDGGANWHGVYSTRSGSGWTTTGLDVTTNYGVHFDPFDRKRVFISYTDIGLMASDDGGASWNSATRAGVPREWVNTTYWMEFDPAVKGRAWAVMSGTHDLPRPKMFRRTPVSTYKGGVAISDDGGRSWRRADGLPPTAATHILLDPASPKEARVLYVAGFGRGVFKSSDGGRTWALKNKGIEGAEPFAWRLARAADGTLYLVVARRSERGETGAGDGALYRSRDGAEHWEKVALPEGLNGPNGIAVDPKDPRRLYLAAWSRSSGPFGEQGGIYLSTDAGATWRNVLSRDQHVYDVTIDPRDPRLLYASGFESSAWRSDDRGETWQRIRGFNFKWGHRVIPDPYHRDRIYVTTFGGSVWYGPAQGDPRAAEDIATRINDGKPPNR